jgi:hypothetical protein
MDKIIIPLFVALVLGCQLESSLLANDDQLVYSEMLNNGWANWGYGSILNLTNSAPVHSGSNSISATLPAWSKIWFVHDPVDTSLYTNFTFWVNGGTSGGQHLQVAASTNGIDGTWINIGPLATNSWQQITVSLAALGVANQTNLNYLWINNWSGTAQPVFYVDDVTLTAKPPPPTIHVSVNAAQTIRTVDARVFGINTAAWDGNLDTSSTISVLTNINNQVLRWPGGSWGDGYHWTNEPWMDGATNARTWGSFSTNFIHVATNTHAQAFIIVNYGSSTPAEAAYGVRMFNVTNHCNFKYWEVGNEVGGSWETDYNTNAPYMAHDPWTYAQRFTDYYNQMKAVDPTIKIGAVADTTEDGTSNYTNHPVVNPRTGVTHNGWTPVMLTYMRSNNVTPDFLICHDYAPGDGDTYNLLWTKTWASHAASMRQMLNDYLGSNVAANVELDGTEFGPAGDKQSISLVSGLFHADMIGQILQTEFNALLRWDLRNGQSPLTNSDNALYGWRVNNSGITLTDGGIVNGYVTPPDFNCYPTYYCMELMKYFARGGDTVVAVTNDYELLGTYAVRRTNGILTMLVVNKSSYASLNAAINLAGYVPSTNATVYSYGIPQDDAARTGIGSMDIVQTNFSAASANFNYTFPPYSATVLSLVPTAPMLVAPAVSPPPGQFVFQLQGVPGVPYVIQNSTDLSTWSSVVTNTLYGSTLNVTNTVNPSLPAQFWRAVWQP